MMLEKGKCAESLENRGFLNERSVPIFERTFSYRWKSLHFWNLSIISRCVVQWLRDRKMKSASNMQQRCLKRVRDSQKQGPPVHRKFNLWTPDIFGDIFYVEIWNFFCLYLSLIAINLDRITRLAAILKASFTSYGALGSKYITIYKYAKKVYLDISMPWKKKLKLSQQSHAQGIIISCWSIWEKIWGVKYYY